MVVMHTGNGKTSCPSVVSVGVRGRRRFMCLKLLISINVTQCPRQDLSEASLRTQRFLSLAKQFLFLDTETIVSIRTVLGS